MRQPLFVWSLINKIGIRDEATLGEAEALATYINATKLEGKPLEDDFDFTHYCASFYSLTYTIGPAKSAP